MIILGLTGSIGMGKSTAAGFFRAAGIPVYCADAAAHELYAQADIAAELERAFPGCAAEGKVDRQKLAALLGRGQTEAERAADWARLEALIHPHIRRKEQQFIARAQAGGAKLAVLDIPLLLEAQAREEQAGKAAKRVGYIAVVSAPYEMQRARVLARPNMTEAKFAAILARQMPDSEKRRRADFIIDTGQSLEATKAQIDALIAGLAAEAEREDK